MGRNDSRRDNNEGNAGGAEVIADDGRRFGRVAGRDSRRGGLGRELFDPAWAVALFAYFAHLAHFAYFAVPLHHICIDILVLFKCGCPVPTYSAALEVHSPAQVECSRFPLTHT